VGGKELGCFYVVRAFVRSRVLALLTVQQFTSSVVANPGEPSRLFPDFAMSTFFLIFSAICPSSL